jgi:hypothetical protein
MERASGQKVYGTEACKSMFHMLSLRVCRMRSACPFCGDVYG